MLHLVTYTVYRDYGHRDTDAGITRGLLVDLPEEIEGQDSHENLIRQKARKTADADRWDGPFIRISIGSVTPVMTLDNLTFDTSGRD